MKSFKITAWVKAWLVSLETRAVALLRMRKVPHVYYWEVMNKFPAAGSLSTDISLNQSSFPSPDRPCVCV